MNAADLARFFNKVDVTVDGCWLFTGGLTLGYGTVRIAGTRKNAMAHRLAYEHSVGPIEPGLQLDHLCRNRACVRPDHLEPVTRRVNILRGAGVTAQNASKTHCKRGHPFTDATTYLRPAGGRTRRDCMECRRIRDRERRPLKVAS